MIPSWYPNKKNELAGIFTKEFADDMAEHCEVSVFYPFDETVDEELVSALENKIKVYRTGMKQSPIPKSGFIYNTFRFLNIFKKILQDFKPDIIHAHVSCPAGYIAAKIGNKYKIPVIITEHNPPEFLFSKKIQLKRCRYAAKKSKLFICVSEKLKQDLQKYNLKGNFITIYNGVRPVENYCNEVLEEEGVSINICSVASMYHKEIKGKKYLLEAVQILILEKDLPIKLHIVGGGEYLDYFKTMAKTLKIEQYCLFYGSLSKKETFRIMYRSNFYVSASLYETFGYSIVEAMLYGKPVVATRCGGPEEIVTEETGVLVSPANKQELSEAIMYMSENCAQFDKNIIQSYAKGKFSQTYIVEKYFDIYKEVLNEWRKENGI